MLAHRQLATYTNSMNFVPIQIKTLPNGLPLQFDVYVRVNKKYILYVRSGDVIEKNRLEKFQKVQGDRLFMNKADIPVLRDFVGILLDETLETKLTYAEDKGPYVQNGLASDEADEQNQIATQEEYFYFSDEKPKSSKKKNSGKSKVKLSAQIQAMINDIQPVETPEQKIQRQVEILNSVAKTSIDIVNKILKDPDSLPAYQVVQKAARGLRDCVERGPTFFQKLFLFNDNSSSGLIEHSKNVALLSLQLGVMNRLNRDQLDDLAIAALLHDIGHTKNHDEMAEDNEASQGQIELFDRGLSHCDEQERATYFKHVEYSSKLVSDKPFIKKTIIDLIESHEERLSGSGPMALVSLDLSQQILSLANCFEKMMREKKQSVKQAIHELAINEIGNFDLKLIDQMKKIATLLNKS